jgi:hypothetical protein
MVYCKEMTTIIEKISTKDELYRVEYIGNQDFVFEVTVLEKVGFGIGSAMVTMECQLWPETNKCECTCNRLMLLLIPCSHVYAARGKDGIEGTYVSSYYLKEAVQATWSGELRGWRALADFTKAPQNGPDWIPDPETKIKHPGRRQSRRIRNNMDDSEARGADATHPGPGRGVHPT